MKIKCYTGAAVLTAHGRQGKKKSISNNVYHIGQLANVYDRTHTDSGDGTVSGWAAANQNIYLLTWVTVYTGQAFCIS